MSNVVSIHKREPLVWVCNCGCTTFKLYEGGMTECASCGIEGAEGGEWVHELPEPPMVAKERLPDTKVLSFADSPASALRTFLSRADAETMVAAIFIHTNGRVRTWGGVDTKDRVRWLQRRLKDAKELLTSLIPEG